jgi:hypothetical protein
MENLMSSVNKLKDTITNAGGLSGLADKAIDKIGLTSEGKDAIRALKDSAFNEVRSMTPGLSNRPSEPTASFVKPPEPGASFEKPKELSWWDKTKNWFSKNIVNPLGINSHIISSDDYVKKDGKEAFDWKVANDRDKAAGLP